MKSIIYLFFLSQIVFCQVTTVQFTQQLSEYDLSLNTSGSGGIFNSGGTAVGMWMNWDNSANGFAGNVLWKTFRIGSSISSSSRPMQIGDEFTITVNTRGFYYGTIGVSLNSGNLPTASWANRSANSRIRIQQDGGNFGPSSPGSWYYTGNTSGSFSLTPTGSYVDYVIKVKLISQNHCNVSINGNWIYDVPLAGNINDQITNFSIYMSDDRSGVWNVNGGNRGDTFWKQTTQLQNTGSINIGASNNSYTISTPLQNGLDANSLSSNNYSNGLTKEGSGTIILTAANNYSGLTTINNGTLQLNRSGGGTIPNTNNITVNSGATLRISSNQTLNNLTVSSGGSVTIDPQVVLKVNGIFNNDGQLVFKSDATGSGMFDQFTGTITGNGTVQVERYIPAKRAFRFVSSPVTTTTTIRQNWQENGGTTAGLGTHITGAGGADNGFDATGTNNPSMYTFTSGAWSAVTNTNVNVLNAGTAYRLMVRGDRMTDLTTNTPTATATTLRATGTLITGDFVPTINQIADGYSLLGNPYQAPIDIKAILTASSNMSSGVVYYWDPTLNARGGYVTRNLTTDANDVTSSFNQYLQPGQAVFVKRDNTANVASVTINESHKSVANGAAGVFRTTTPNNFGLFRVNLQANTNNQWQTIEGTLAIFNDNYSWAVTQEDATKMSNLDEEVSFVQNDTSLAIACVSAPSANSELPIQLNNLRHSNYQWQFELTNYQGERPYLFDAQNNTYIEITNGTTVPFTTTTAAANRFKIVFQPSALSADDFTHGLVVYPNPAKAGANFYVQGITAAQVTVYNVLGQNIPVQVKSQGNALQVTPTQTLSQGIYLVTVTTEGKTQHIKWIVE